MVKDIFLDLRLNSNDCIDNLTLYAYKLILAFYTCFDWFKRLRLFVNERNLKIDVVLKAPRVVVIR